MAWEEQLELSGETNWVVVAQPGKRFEIQIFCEDEAAAGLLRQEHGGKVQKLKEENWVELSAQQNSGKFLKIRDRIVVTLDPDKAFVKKLQAEYPERTILQFPPDLAFGTGDHATTATCLRFLVDLSRKLNPGKKPWSVLDLGTGTGILAVAAEKLGAERIFACDYDEKSIRVSEKSLQANGIAKDRIELMQLDLLKPGVARALGNRKYTVITANLFSTVLVQVMPQIRRSLAKQGWAILSGILAKQSAEVEAAAKSEGLTLQRKVTRGRWVSLLLQPGKED